MTDRVKGFTVILDDRYRVDDVEVILSAVRMIKGIKQVDPIVDDTSAYIAERSKETEIRDKLYEFIRENLH